MNKACEAALTWPEAFQNVGLGVCAVVAIGIVCWGFLKLCDI